MVYRYISDAFVSEGKRKFVGREIASNLGMSPNTVNLAVKQLSKIGCAMLYKRHFEISNFDKLLIYWAVNRKFEKDIVYRTYVEAKGHDEIERHMPEGIVLTNYSAYVKLFGNDASDYSEVYVYANDSAFKAIKERFPPQQFSQRSDYHNLIVLKPDYVMEKEIMERLNVTAAPSPISAPYAMPSPLLRKGTVSLAQLYVDLWNAKEWYSNEFLKRLKMIISAQDKLWTIPR